MKLFISSSLPIPKKYLFPIPKKAGVKFSQTSGNKHNDPQSPVEEKVNSGTSKTHFAATSVLSWQSLLCLSSRETLDGTRKLYKHPWLMMSPSSSKHLGISHTLPHICPPSYHFPQRGAKETKIHWYSKQRSTWTLRLSCEGSAMWLQGNFTIFPATPKSFHFFKH